MGVRTDGFLPIGGNGLVGDCRSAARVGVDGAVDWCCLPRFDSPSLFAALLDPDQGGWWRISPTVPFDSWQRYAEKTSVLQTIFETTGGRAEITDFMPVDGQTVREHARPSDRPPLVRVVTGLAGRVRFRHQVDLRPDYARQPNPLQLQAGVLHGDAGGYHYHLSATVALTGADQEFEVGPGDTVAFGLTVNDAGSCGPGIAGVEEVRPTLRTTRQYWWNWV